MENNSILSPIAQVYRKRKTMVKAPHRMPLLLCGFLCDTMHMATNIELDDRLMQEALRLGNQRSKRATIEEALHEYVQRRKQREILGQFGQIDYDKSYDYKARRKRS